MRTCILSTLKCHIAVGTNVDGIKLKEGGGKRKKERKNRARNISLSRSEDLTFDSFIDVKWQGIRL